MSDPQEPPNPLAVPGGPDHAPAGGGPEMSVLEHLEELRWRIVKAVAAVFVAGLVVFAFNNPIILMLERPLNPAFNVFGPGTTQTIELIFTAPGEYFFAVIKVALLGGLYLALPVILFQLLAFISPGLLPNERKWALPIVIGSFLFFTVGAVFAYFLLLPAGLQFLVGFAPPEVKALLSVGKYLSFAAGLMFATGLAFQLPLFLLGASAAGVVTSYYLKRFRRQAFFAAFVLAALITPSIDIFTQVMLAGALYLLFELSIFLIRLTGK
ncbi:MAG: twin-arginine translocase subunit TatC [Candidatus Sericytochromatia bacterium]